MGLHDDRNLQTSRANNTFSEGIGLEKIDMKAVEEARNRKKTAKELQREEIRGELLSIWLRYLNSGKNNGPFFDDIIDYIISKGCVKKKKLQ